MDDGPTPEDIGDAPTEPAAPSFEAVSGEPVPGSKPERLGPYVLGETLGWGGMGIVYAAVDERSGDAVAVKLLRFSDPEGVSLRRFQQEAEATRRLNHPNIIGQRDVGREGTFDYLVMDLVRGRDLATWLREERPTPQRAAALLAEVARAVDHAHRRGILHRDLKPSNIIVRADGSPAVTDFGLARAIGAESSLTATDQAVGTPQYMSPEQARGRHQDCGPQSDVWSLGVMLYELCAGCAPFGGDTVLQIMQRVVHDEPELPRRFKEDAPLPLERIAMQCLEKRASDRYSSAEALAEDLERFVGGVTVTARRYSSWTRALRWTARRWRLVALAGVILVLASVTAVLAASRFGGEGRWVEAFAWRAGAPTAGMAFYRREGAGSDDGWPRGQDGLVMTQTWCWLEDLRVPGDVRVELTVRTGEDVDGIEVVINSRQQMAEQRSWAHVPHGYSAQFGGYVGAIDFISRNTGAQISNFTYASASGLRPGSVHELVFQRRGDLFELEVDGERTNRVVFPVPVAGEGLDRIGLRSYAKGLEMLKLRVLRLAGSEREDRLAMGDAAMRLGRIATAVDEYEAVAEAFPGSKVAARALTRAYLVGRQDEAVAGVRLDAIRARLEEGFPGDQALALLREFDAVDACRARDWDRVVALMDQAHDEDPESQIAQRVLEVGVLPNAQPAVDTMLAALGRSRHLQALRWRGVGITDIKVLAGSPLIWLDLAGNRIEDLSPLAGMPLRFASLDGNRIGNLSALAGMPLGWLTLSGNPIRDLSPLTGMPLQRLSLARIDSLDLRTLGVTSLERLDLSGCRISDLSPLAGTQLRELVLAGTSVSDLSPLSGVPLTWLDVRGCPVSDLAPVAAAPLVELRASGCRIESLPNFSGGQLAKLDLTGNAVSDLSPLADLPLRQVELAGNAVSDLSPLADSPVEELNIVDNQVTDLSPLAGLPLIRLLAYGNPVVELGEFDAGAAHIVIGDGRQQLPDAAIEALLVRWRDDPVHQRHAAGLQALRSWRDDLEQARLWARQAEGIEAVFVPRWLSYAQARVLAAAAEGRLATAEEVERLRDDLVPPGHHVWLESGISGPGGRVQIDRGWGPEVPPTERHPLLVVWDPTVPAGD